MPQSNAPIRVFLADDSAPIRARVGSLLQAAGDDVVGEAQTPRDCIAGILALRPDVVVLDVQLHGGTGLDVLRGVCPVAPEVAFVVFTNSASPAYRTRYLREGALDFLDKSADAGELVRSVSQAARHACA